MQPGPRHEERATGVARLPLHPVETGRQGQHTVGKTAENFALLDPAAAPGQ